MPMEREKHEEILNELLTPDLEVSRRTELLQSLRADYSTVITDHTENTKSVEDLRKDNNDLIISNSKLFRQIGVVGKEEEEKVEEKEFSETVTLTQLEQGAN